MQPTRMCLTIAMVAAFAAVPPGPASAGSAYDFDGLGAEFCRLTLEGNLNAMPVVLSPSLVSLLGRAAAKSALPPTRTLFQSYQNQVDGCTATTRSPAIVDIRREARSGSPAWIDQLVVVPQTDGTSRIDDVLFATRRSDTLRSRLSQLAGE